jgi:hypothetical protein
MTVRTIFKRLMIPILLFISFFSGFSCQTGFSVRAYLSGFARGSQHELAPYGVPWTYSWAHTASGEEWTHLKPLYGETHANWWGEVFPYSEPVFPENVRVAVTNNVFLALFEGDTSWKVMQEGRKIEGIACKYDYSEVYGSLSDIRKEPDGSYSFLPVPGGNSHYWPTIPLAKMDTGRKLVAVIIISHMCLIPDQADGPDNLRKARYIGAIGIDWKFADGSGPVELGYCDGIIHGKFIELTPQWRVNVATSMTAEQIRTLPLPDERYFKMPNGKYPM